MGDPTLKLLTLSDFNPDKYVRELSQNCIGGPELVRLHNKVQTLSEEINGNLKKNVYQNYMQFIDTAKEISHLESEMYQLSHLLSEQRSLLTFLSNTSVLGDETPLVLETDSSKQNGEEQEEEVRRHKLATILENVEGCGNILDIPGRLLIHEGDLLELDPVENNPLKRIHGYLFTDGLMLAAWNANRRGPMRYKFEAFYELGSLAVVNVRDLANVKYAFKLLAFPDTKLFQSTSNSTKKEWLDKFDQAKKARLAQDQIKRESISEKSPSRTISIESPSLNPFEEIEEDVALHPEWLLETPEELDVYVAQRHFEDALNLLQKAKEYFSHYVPPNGQPDHQLTEIKRKVEQRHLALTDVLMKELEVSPDKSLQGGLRAARRAVRLLNQLGRSTQSCNLFLKLCSSMMRTQCKRVKREGSATVYIRHLSSVVFTNMCHMTEEFLRAFPDSSSCSSSFVVWASSELSIFTTHFIKQVFISQTSLTTLTECVVLARTQCERLCAYGIDLCYQLDGAFRTPLTRALRDARDKLTDAIKLRSLEGRWIPTNLKSKSGLARCLQEHAELGINLDNYVTGDCWLQLTSNTLSFTKLFLSLLEDCLKLQTSELLYTINETLLEVFTAQVKYLEQSLRNEKQADQRSFITKNADFLLVTLLGLAQKKYITAVGFECSTLAKLIKEHSALLHGVTPTNRQITKYSSNEYL
ncbi:hypothetical protein ILUMI_25421 [Ignelater luminosus]|uniref:Exocyst complex component 8 n=1 Tax=Ignelater luminosus TaxID=2038154 RepID=A0A8K0C5K9_IGNLU|nr:hypothetical protein ILUMI_25421 [Ignelater luminosus]